MNIFKTYVKRNIKNNRLRTTMTIVGIILSVALVAAVIEGAFSGVEYVRNILKNAYGNHHGYVMNMEMDTAYELIQKDEVDAYTTFNTVGWADIGSQNSTKPYLLIKEATEDITDFLSVKITAGHFPQEDDEILISEHLATNGNVQYKVGDTITLTVSERYLDEQAALELSDENEESYSYNYYYTYGVTSDELNSVSEDGIIPEVTRFLPGERLLTAEDGFPVFTKTYTVCGIMNRLPYTIEQYMCPGYTAIVKSPSGSTTGNQGTVVTDKKLNGKEIPSYNVFFRVKDPAGYNEFHNTFEKEHPGVYMVKNRELLAMYGGVRSYSITLFLTGFVIVLIALILFGSIALVYNSFSISINERTKQIGILKSVGATKKQIRKTILYEAFFECAIAIPLGIILGCVGIGVTFLLLQEGFEAFFGYFGGFDSSGIKIKLVISVPLIIVAIVIVIVAVLLSIAIPALRASTISPIDLVRQNADIRVSGKIRKSRILSRIFGAEGMLASKNYSRNKKRYRSTIVSLSVSIILFIAASSFCHYLTSATDSELYTGNVDLIFYEYSAESFSYDDEVTDFTEPTGTRYREIKEMLSSADDVSKVIVSYSLYDYAISDPSVTGEGFSSQSITKELNDELDMAMSADTPITESSSEPVIYEGAIVPEENYLDDFYGNSAGVYFIDDESFFELLKNEKIPVPEQKDGELNAVVFNEGTKYLYDAEGLEKKMKYNFINDDEVPKTYKFDWYNEYGNTDISPINQVVDLDGEVYVVYLDNSLVQDYFNIIDSDGRWRLEEEALYAEFRKYLESIGKDSEGVSPYGWDDLQINLEDDSLSATESDSTLNELRPLTEEELALIAKCTFVNREDLKKSYDLNIIGVTYDQDYQFSSEATIILPFSAIPEEIKDVMTGSEYYIFSNNSNNSEESINKLLLDNHLDTGGLYNVDSANVGRRMIGKIVSVFSYGFILLISLVAIANVFNTISTNVHLRRREFGMLKSMGLSNKGVSKILNIECLIYGSWSLIIGLPLSVPITWCLYKITSRAFAVQFTIPWYSVAIAVAAVFIVVFVTMIYASGKIKKDNTLDALRAENI